MSTDTKNLMLAGLALVGMALYLKGKKSYAAGAATAPLQTKNVNSQLWTRLLGDGWRNLVSAQNSDGTPAFLMKNQYGQVVTSDGVPVDGGDPLAAWVSTQTGLPDPSVEQGFTVGELFGGSNPNGDPLNGFRTQFDYFNGQ